MGLTRSIVPDSDAEILTDLVAADGSSGGFVKDSEVSTFARTYLDETSTRATNAVLGTWHVLAASAVAVPHTGNTDQTTLGSVTIPAGAMGPNGLLRITSLWSWTSSANNKTARINFGGTAYGEYFGGTGLSAGVQDSRTVSNRNSASSQVGSQAAQSFAYTASAPRTTSVNTANSTTVTFAGTLASSGETITLESYLVELFYAA